MIDETTRKKIVLLIWRGFGFIEIGRQLRTLDTLPTVEDKISHAAIEIRNEVENLVETLPGDIETALRRGFTAKEVFDGIMGVTDLVPTWNLDNFIAAAQKRIDDENRPEREAAEKAASDARRAAIAKQIADAKQALRDMGAPVE